MDNNNWNPSSWNLPPAFTNQIYNSNTGNIEQEMDILEFANTPYDFFQNTPFINFNNNPSFIQPKTNNNTNPTNSPSNLNSAPTSKNNSKESISKSTQKRSLSNDSDEKTSKKKNNSKKALTENEKEKSRNASRDYRKRKKEYIEGLEKKVSGLENEVKKLMQMNEDQAKNLEKERDHKRKFEIGRKYQEEWGTNMQKLENLLKDTKDKDADQKIYSIVEHMKILFEKMLNFFKDQYVAQIDFSIFAHFSLFARDSYHFETYGDDTNISVSLINNNVTNIKNGLFTPNYQKQINNNNNNNSPSPFSTNNITIGDTTFDGHFSLDGDQDQENFQVEIHKDDEEYVDKILFEEEKVMGLKDTDMSIWTKLTEGLNVSQQVFSKLKLLLNNLRANILKLKIQHAKINTDLSLFIKTEMGDAMKDVGKIVQITAKLGNLQKNYNKYWFIWSTALQDIHSLFTPKQLAYIWVRKSRYLDNCNILNSIWMTLNRQTFSNIQTLPSFIPPFPL